RLKGKHPRVVYQNVESPKALHRLSNYATHVRNLAHVSLDRNRLPTLRFDPGDDLFGLVRALAIVDHDRGALLREPLCNRPSDAGRGPRDDGHFFNQRTHSSSLLSFPLHSIKNHSGCMISLMVLPCPSDAPCSMHCVLTKFTLCLDPILQGMSIRRPAREVDLIR